MIAVILSLAASVCWGVGDLIGGLASRKGPAWTITLAAQCAGVVAGFVLLVGLGRPWPGWGGILPAVAVGLALAIGSVAYFTALARGKMSVVAPIVATCAVVPVIWGVVRGDSLSLLQVGGIVLALVGVAFASRESADEPVPVGALEASTMVDGHAQGGRWSVPLALVAAFFFGAVMVGFAVAAEHDPYYPPVISRAVSALLIAGVLAARRRPLMPPRAVRRPALVAGLLHVTAATCFSVASTLGYLSVVSVLSSMQAIVMVALAHVVLRERLAVVQRIGVVLAIVGALAVVAG